MIDVTELLIQRAKEAANRFSEASQLAETSNNGTTMNDTVVEQDSYWVALAAIMKDSCIEVRDGAIKHLRGTLGTKGVEIENIGTGMQKMVIRYHNHTDSKAIGDAISRYLTALGRYETARYEFEEACEFARKTLPDGHCQSHVFRYEDGDTLTYRVEYTEENGIEVTELTGMTNETHD